MSKIICDICGTEYPESEDFCPNCGCSQDVSADMDMELEDDNFLEDSPITAVRKQKEAAAAEDAEKAAAECDAADPEPESEDGEEEPTRGTGLVILLTVLIMVLLGSVGFLFVKYILPSMELGRLPEQTDPAVHEQLDTETAGPEIPCRILALISGGAVELTREGEYRLIHVIVKPEDTTDTLIYTSSDENVVTVTGEGRLEAVGEGEATVTMNCGSQSLTVRVTVAYVEETVPPTEAETEPQDQTEPAEETVSGQTEAIEETVPETTSPQLKDVTLKLGKTEFILPPGYTYTVPLECDLSYEEIEWSMEHPYIASVENGVVKGLTTGVTVLTAKYGDQTVTCTVRIKKI